MSHLSVWLTPIWLIGVGTTIGLLILLLLWGVLAAVNRQSGQYILRTVQESILLPVSYVLVALAVIAVMATPLMPTDRMWASLQRVFETGPTSITFEVPANTRDFEVELSTRVDELQSYAIESQEDIAVTTEPDRGFDEPLIIVKGDTTYEWPSRSIPRAFEDDFDTLYIENESGLSTQVTAKFTTDVEMPQVRDIVFTASSVIGLFLVYFLVNGLAPRLSVISTATSKEAISQPLYLLLLALGVVLLISYVFIPYNTFGEDVKMLMTTGMVTIKFLAILVALWTASISVAEEIEGRTALTVLSKPVGRRQFIFGKFLGLCWPILLMFIVLGIVFLFTVSIKVVYDARESSKLTPEWQDCYVEVIRVLPGLLLSFFEAVVFASISVAISTRMSMIPNLAICGSIYLVGHLGPLIVKSAAGKLVFVKFIGQFIAALFPVLDHYDIEGAISGSHVVPSEYLWMALLYSALYCTVAMLLALFFFEDRDLA